MKKVARVAIRPWLVADIGGGLFAANMLFARLQREHVATVAIDILGDADDPARHAAQQLVGGGEQAEVGAAIRLGIAQRLAFTHDHIRAPVAGSFKHAHRQRIGHDDGQRAGFVHAGDQRREVFDAAEEVRILENDRGHVGRERGVQIFVVEPAATQRQFGELHAERAGERFGDLAVMRVHTDRARARGCGRCA